MNSPLLAAVLVILYYIQWICLVAYRLYNKGINTMPDIEGKEGVVQRDWVCEFIPLTTILFIIAFSRLVGVYSETDEDDEEEEDQQKEQPWNDSYLASFAFVKSDNISNLRKNMHDDDDNDDDDSRICAICLEPCVQEDCDNSTIWTTKKCGHSFHMECIKLWCHHQHNSNRALLRGRRRRWRDPPEEGTERESRKTCCPCCRTPLEFKDDSLNKTTFPPRHRRRLLLLPSATNLFLHLHNQWPLVGVRVYNRLDESLWMGVALEVTRLLSLLCTYDGNQ